MTIDHTQISVWVVLCAVAVDAVIVVLMMLGATIATRSYRRRQAMRFAAYLADRTALMLNTLRAPLDAASLDDARTQIDESLRKLKDGNGDGA